jgi:pantothenate kinase, type III
MILLVDVGNSRIKWSLGFGEGCVAGAFGRSSPRQDGDNLVAVMSGTTAPVEVWVASVASLEFQGSLTKAVTKAWGCNVRFARVQSDLLGLQPAYDDVQQLGVDRWLAMLAARYRAKQRAIVVIDAGSAITVDYVSSAGRHLGGLIAPGVKMMQRALYSNTALVKVKPLTLPQTWRPGQDTLGCVEQGVATMLQGFCAQLSANVDLLESEFKQAAWFATGGDAVLFSLPETHDISVVDDLVLQGLNLWGLSAPSVFV